MTEEQVREIGHDVHIRCDTPKQAEDLAVVKWRRFGGESEQEELERLRALRDQVKALGLSCLEVAVPKAPEPRGSGMTNVEEEDVWEGIRIETPVCGCGRSRYDIAAAKAASMGCWNLVWPSQSCRYCMEELAHLQRPAYRIVAPKGA